SSDLARAWSQKLIREGGKAPEQRLNLAFRMATARPPTAAEQQLLVQAFRRVLSQFQADRASAMKLVSVGEASPAPHVDVVELAAYTALLNMVLNLDEVITKE